MSSEKLEEVDDSVYVKPEEGSLLFTLDSSFTKAYQHQRQLLLGRVLTIIDASVSDREQRKAIKDLIHGAFWEYRQSNHKLLSDLFERLFEFEKGEENQSSPEGGNQLPCVVPGVADSKVSKPTV